MYISRWMQATAGAQGLSFAMFAESGSAFFNENSNMWNFNEETGKP